MFCFAFFPFFFQRKLFGLNSLQRLFYFTDVGLLSATGGLKLNGLILKLNWW